MSESGNPWDELELEPTTDERAIKRAYARRLKVCSPEEDAQAFQRLRTAYEAALQMARAGWFAYELQEGPELVATPADLASDAPAPDPEADHGTSEAGRQVPSAQQQEDAPEIEWREHGDDYWLDLQTRAASYCTELLSAPMDNSGQAYEALRAMFGLLEFNDAALRDEFELALLRTLAADEGRPTALAIAAAKMFRWEQEQDFLSRREWEAARVVLGHLQSEKYYERLRHMAARGSRPEALLLAPEPPLGHGETMDRRIVESLRQLLRDLRWNAPAVLNHRIAPSVLEFWEDHVSQPRLYWQHLLLAVALMWPMPVLFRLAGWTDGYSLDQCAPAFILVAGLAYGADALRFHWLAGLGERAAASPLFNGGWVLVLAALFALACFVSVLPPWAGPALTLAGCLNLAWACIHLRDLEAGEQLLGGWVAPALATIFLFTIAGPPLLGVLIALQVTAVVLRGRRRLRAALGALPPWGTGLAYALWRFGWLAAAISLMWTIATQAPSPRSTASAWTALLTVAVCAPMAVRFNSDRYPSRYLFSTLVFIPAFLAANECPELHGLQVPLAAWLLGSVFFLFNNLLDDWLGRQARIAQTAGQ